MSEASSTTWSLSTEAADRLEAAADRGENESATEFVHRVATLVEDGDVETDGTDRHTDLPEDVLTEAHLADLAEMVSRRTINEFETRFR